MDLSYAFMFEKLFSKEIPSLALNNGSVFNFFWNDYFEGSGLIKYQPIIVSILSFPW